MAEEIKLFCYPHEGGGFQIEVVCGGREVEIHIDDPCDVFVLTDTKGKPDEMVCNEYTPVAEQYSMLPAVEAIKKAFEWVRDG